MIIVIPAYRPGEALPDLVAQLALTAPDLSVVVVDDGSGAEHEPWFDAAARAGATVVSHEHNRGKGVALRTGIAHAIAAHPGRGVVTADADGQHTVRDIVRVARAVDTALVLGCRRFDGRVPLRSRAGNVLARAAFRLAAGWSLSDTQTGLRGIPAAMLPWMLAQRGDRYEYEQNVLLHAHRDGWKTREVEIETVYIADNSSSHFRPIVDSLRVSLPIVLFAASSLLAFAVDTVALLLFTALTGWLVPSIIAARLVSGAVNFTINRTVVFSRGDGRPSLRGAAGRYAVLAVVLLVSNVVWMTALTSWGVPLLVAKLITESVLFLLGYALQRGVVFAGDPQSPERRPDDLVSAGKAPLSNGEDFGTRMVADTHPRRRTP